jgi:hypothetical protein
MTIIAEKDRATVQNLLARELVEDVELLLFTRGRSRLFDPGGQESQSCEETRELLEELVSLSDQIHLTAHDVDAEPATATRYNVAAVPTVIVRRRLPAIDTPEAGLADVASGADAAETDASEAGNLSPAPVARSTAAEACPVYPDVGGAGGGANVRFLGLPGGYEFSTLLADVVDVSKGRTDLSAEALALVRAIDTPVHIQVFVTPT